MTKSDDPSTKLFIITNKDFCMADVLTAYQLPNYDASSVSDQWPGVLVIGYFLVSCTDTVSKDSHVFTGGAQHK